MGSTSPTEWPNMAGLPWRLLPSMVIMTLSRCWSRSMVAISTRRTLTTTSHLLTMQLKVDIWPQSGEQMMHFWHWISNLQEEWGRSWRQIMDQHSWRMCQTWRQQPRLLSAKGNSCLLVMSMMPSDNTWSSPILPPTPPSQPQSEPSSPDLAWETINNFRLAVIIIIMFLLLSCLGVAHSFPTLPSKPNDPCHTE